MFDASTAELRVVGRMRAIVGRYGVPTVWGSRSTVGDLSWSVYGGSTAAGKRVRCSVSVVGAPDFRPGSEDTAPAPPQRSLLSTHRSMTLAESRRPP